MMYIILLKVYNCCCKLTETDSFPSDYIFLYLLIHIIIYKVQYTCITQKQKFRIFLTWVPWLPDSCSFCKDSAFILIPLSYLIPLSPYLQIAHSAAFIKPLPAALTTCTARPCYRPAGACCYAHIQSAAQSNRCFLVRVGV